METTFEAIEKSQGEVARERLMQDLQSLTRDAEDLLTATAGDVSEKAKEARSRVTAALDRAKKTYTRLQDQSISSAKAAAKKADTVIRDHPYESIGVAFGLGLLLGVVIGRR